MGDVKSIARVPQRRVNVNSPTFQPAGDEQQRLYTEGEPVPPTTDADTQARVDREDKYTRLNKIMGKPGAATPDPTQPTDRKARLPQPQDGSQEDPMVSLDKEVSGQQPDDVNQSESPDAKPPGSYEETPEEAKAKFKLQISNALQEGSITPEEIEEIKRLGR